MYLRIAVLATANQNERGEARTLCLHIVYTGCRISEAMALTADKVSKEYRLLTNGGSWPNAVIQPYFPSVRYRAISGQFKNLGECPDHTQYSHSALLSVILITADRYLPVTAGHAPADYEYSYSNLGYDVYRFSFESAGAPVKLYLSEASRFISGWCSCLAYRFHQSPFGFSLIPPIVSKSAPNSPYSIYLVCTEPSQAPHPLQSVHLYVLVHSRFNRC